MASIINPSFSPNYGEKPWVDHISKNLKSQIAVTIDTPPVSIYEIPTSLKAEKPEAYVPQRVGLGPYHHFHPDLYHKMEQKKLTAVKRVLKPHQVQDFEQEIIQKVKKIVPLIRDCYDLYHDGDDNMLAWLFAIDGMFLIDQINGYAMNRCFAIEANDLFMLENQIPLIALKEIQKGLLGQDANEQEDYLEPKFRSFCKSHSSFVLSNENIEFSRVNHLLDYMYSSIMNNETLAPIKVDITTPGSDPSQKDGKQELLEAVIKFVEVIPRAEPFHLIIEFVTKKFPELEEGKAMAEEIKVPSASELHKIARVEFCLSPENEGIRNINFVQGKARYCYLPMMTLNANSEVILRNLVAYEKLMAKDSFVGGYGTLELTQYVDFMCGIIDSAKDVKVLRERKIIQGDLSDEEIVKLFNRIGKSRVKMSVESKLRKSVAQLNSVYESTWRVWVRRLIERQFLATVKVFTFLVSVLSVLILIREGYLMVFGLDSHHRMMARVLRAKFKRLLLFFVRPKGPTATA